jgi:hypothetical protein
MGTAGPSYISVPSFHFISAKRAGKAKNAEEAGPKTHLFILAIKPLCIAPIKSPTGLQCLVFLFPK